MGRVAFVMLLALVLVPLAPSGAAATHRPFLVAFDGDLPLAGDTLAGALVTETFPFAGLAALQGPASAMRAIAALPGVAGVYEDEPVTLAMERERGLIAADPLPGARWPTGEGVTVALVDSGIDGAHPAFQGRVAASVRVSRGGAAEGAPQDDDGHGTHVAGIVGGDGARSVDGRHRGIAPGAKLVGIDISESFTTTNAVRAFAWIHDNQDRYGIRVVSNSWGREKEDAHYDADDPVIRASDALVADGIVVVFSAGNRGRDGASTLTTEATNPNVITVGAAGANGRVEGYSSRGPAIDGKGRALDWVKPDLAAPGTAVISTRATAFQPANARGDEERYYTAMNGTSMAAPQVAAAAALLLSEYPDLSPATVQHVLQASARDLGASGADSDTGHGMLDVEAALREAAFLAGGERRVVVERVVPVRASGSLAQALGNVVLTDSAPRLPPAQSVTLPLVAPPGAASVDLWLNWSGESGLDAKLVGPRGSVAFEPRGGRSWHVSAPIMEGAWRVEASPTGAAGRATYTLEGGITVREEKVVSVAAEPHGRAVRANGAFAVAESPGQHAMELLEGAPGLVIAVLAITGCALVARRRR